MKNGRWEALEDYQAQRDITVRYTCIGTLIVLLIFTLFPAKADPAILFEGIDNTWGRRLTVWDDALYILDGDQHLYRYTGGDQVEALADVNMLDIDALISGTDALYGSSYESGKLYKSDAYPIQFEEVGQIANWDADMSFATSPLWIDGGSIYLLRYHLFESITYLCRGDLLTGKIDALAEGVYHAALYSPGTLIVFARGQDNRGDVILSYDTTSGTSVERGVFPYTSRVIGYDMSGDAVYIQDIDSGQLMVSYGFSAFEPVAVVPRQDTSRYKVMPGGYVVFDYDDCMRVYGSNRSENIEKTTLKISAHDSEMLKLAEYAAAYPFVMPVLMPVQRRTTDQLVMDMAGPDAADIYAVKPEALRTLIEKGYGINLSGCENIVNETLQLYPFIRDAIKHGGDIYGFPCEIGISCNRYFLRALNAIGLSDDDIPKTWTEFFRFIQTWQVQYGDNNPGMTLFGNSFGEPIADGAKHYLHSQILGEYAAVCNRNGIPLADNLHLLLEPLQIMASIDFETAVVSTGHDQSPYDMYAPPFILFGPDFGLDVDQPTVTMSCLPMPLSVGGDMAPAALADISILIINPYSKQIDAAADFIEFFAANMTAKQRTEWMPSVNMPIRSLDYDQMLADCIDKLAEIDALIKDADEGDRLSYQQLYDQISNELRYIKDTEWQISAGNIAVFRSVDDFFTVKASNILNEDTALADLSARFCDGQINAAQYIEAVEQKLRMMALEN